MQFAVSSSASRPSTAPSFAPRSFIFSVIGFHSNTPWSSASVQSPMKNTWASLLSVTKISSVNRPGWTDRMRLMRFPLMDRPSYRAFLIAMLQILERAPLGVVAHADGADGVEPLLRHDELGLVCNLAEALLPLEGAARENLVALFGLLER